VVSNSFSAIDGSELTLNDKYEQRVTDYFDKEFIIKSVDELNDKEKLNAVVKSLLENENDFEEYKTKIDIRTGDREVLEKQYKTVVKGVEELYKLLDSRQYQDHLETMTQLKNEKVANINQDIRNLQDKKEKIKNSIESTKIIKKMVYDTWLEKNDIQNRYNCKICYDNHIDRIITACGHTFCSKCLESIDECPVCKIPKGDVRKIYEL